MDGGVMGCWTVGHNLAGYMPESDVWAFSEWQDAADAYVDEVKRYADEDDAMADEDGDEPTMRRDVDDELDACPLDEGRPHGMVITDNRERMISLWLDWSDEDPPEDEGWLA